MALQFRVLTNARPTKDMPDFRTTSTAGTIQFNPEVLKTMGVGIGSALVAAELPAMTNQSATFTDGEEIIVFLPGVPANPAKLQKTIGSMITDIANKCVVSTQNVYNQLRGNNEEINKFDLSEAFDGIVENADGTYTGWRKGEAIDGTLNIVKHEMNEKGIVTGVEWVESTDGEGGLPFFAATFVGSEPKMEKAKSSSPATKSSGKGNTKGNVGNPADLDDF